MTSEIAREPTRTYASIEDFDREFFPSLQGPPETQRVIVAKIRAKLVRLDSDKPAELR